MKFLIADDNEINRQFLSAVLSDPQHQIWEARNGHEAIARCREQQFDLVFMDIRMPEMDGIEATREIRSLADHEPQKTCIIALTADLQLKQRDDLLKNGFAACLTKPIGREHLLETVRRVQQGLCLEAEASQKGAASEAPIDLQRAMAATGGNKELLDKLTSMFATELEQLVPDIDRAIEIQDFDSARDIAHKLRASAGYCGAIDLQQSAASMERATLARDEEAARQSSAELNRQSSRLLSYLETL